MGKPSEIKKGNVLWGFLMEHGGITSDTRVEMFSVLIAREGKLVLESSGRKPLSIERALTQPVDEWPIHLRASSLGWLAIFDSHETALAYLNTQRAWQRLHDAARKVYPRPPKHLMGCESEIEKATAALDALFTLARNREGENNT